MTTAPRRRICCVSAGLTRPPITAAYSGVGITDSPRAPLARISSASLRMCSSTSASVWSVVGSCARIIRLLWLALLVSITGSQMQLVAINWHVYLLTHSPLALGLVGLVRVVPIILCSLIGGVVADAIDRKRLMIVTQVVMLASAAALA